MKVIEAIKDKIEFLRDPQFSIRFKIANIILGDDFTTYIIFARMDAKEILESNKLYERVPEAQAKMAELRAKHIIRDLDEVIKGR